MRWVFISISSILLPLISAHAEMGQQTVNPRIYTRNTCMPAAYPLHCGHETTTLYFISPPQTLHYFPPIAQMKTYIPKPSTITQYFNSPATSTKYYSQMQHGIYYRVADVKRVSMHTVPAKATKVSYRKGPEISKSYYAQPETAVQLYYPKLSQIMKYYTSPSAIVLHHNTNLSQQIHHYATPNLAVPIKGDRMLKFDYYAPNGYLVRYRLPGNISWRHCVQDSTKMQAF